MNSAVERAITSIWERYSEPLSLADIARSAILSRFHFSRVFREATGVSPGRFLSAVRIYQAKRMLIATSRSVTDISYAVGYNSLGSFTNHFTDSVGVSPSRFRETSKNGVHEFPDPAPGPSALAGTVAGRLVLPPGYRAARAYVGTFKTPIVEGRPLSSAVIHTRQLGRPASYRLARVPAGEWFIRAVALADGDDPETWTDGLLVAGQGPVKVTADTVTDAELRLRPCRPADPPILLALPGLDTETVHLNTGPFATAAS